MKTINRTPRNKPITIRKIPCSAELLACKDEENKTVAERLTDLKNENRLSIEQFAARCGAPKTTAAEWLSGRRLPSAEYLSGIAQGFFVSIDWILSGAPNAKDKSRSKTEFETELADRISAHIATVLSCSVENVIVDAKRVFEEVTENVTKRCQDDVARIQKKILTNVSIHARRSRIQALLQNVLGPRSIPKIAGWETQYEELLQQVVEAINDLDELGTLAEADWSGSVRLRSVSVKFPRNSVQPDAVERVNRLARSLQKKSAKYDPHIQDVKNTIRAMRSKLSSVSIPISERET